MMSLAHPLSTGSASKFYKCFDGEFFFLFSWLFSCQGVMNSKSWLIWRIY
jgi:hypothetical protein